MDRMAGGVQITTVLETNRPEHVNESIDLMLLVENPLVRDADFADKWFKELGDVPAFPYSREAGPWLN